MAIESIVLTTTLSLSLIAYVLFLVYEETYTVKDVLIVFVFILIPVINIIFVCMFLNEVYDINALWTRFWNKKLK